MSTIGDPLDYFETVQILNAFAGSHVVVYPAVEPPEGQEAPGLDDLTSGLAVWGTFSPQHDPAAAGRRGLSDFYETALPELALGDAPLELYERQVAHYTFEGMYDDLRKSYAGFAVWQHAFIESRWLDVGGRFHWLWIRARPTGFVVGEQFEPPPSAAR